MMMNDDDDDPKMFRKFLETRHTFSTPKVIFLIFLEIKFTWKKFAVFWKILKNLFFCGKKSNLNFQNRGYFGKKNVPQIS